MAGQGSPGVTLTPNRNVNAPAGVGGDRWGANGGGITPVGGVGSAKPNPTNWAPPLKQTLSNGQTDGTQGVGQVSTGKATPIPLMAGMANGAVPGHTFDTMTADASVLATADTQSVTADTQL
jgi:hypothetical protein